MVNPQQRRKQRSGIRKTKQSRRQQDKLKKVVVKGPAALVQEWDIHKTARQNYEAMGLSFKRPMALTVAGGEEKDLVPLDALRQAKTGSKAGPSEDEDMYADSDEEEEESEEGASGETAQQKSAPPPTSKDIPKGFARIERDANGKILRIVMSAHDGGKDDEPVAEESEKTADVSEPVDTPWGAPLNDVEHEARLAESSAPVEAKSKALASLEALSSSQRLTTSASKRFTSPAELAFLQKLISKHGKDLDAMKGDIKLNRDQRTKGQLKKMIERAGGWEALAAGA